MAASDARLRMMCSHGGRFLPCGGRYVGGETRVLVVPRVVSFRHLAGRLGELAGAGKMVTGAIKYRIRIAGDDDDVVVSVTCDEELAHMRDEHDRLKATRPSAILRVFFSIQRRGLPPLPPRCVQSEQAVARPAGPAPAWRRVHSAHQIAGSSRLQPCCNDSCHLRRDMHHPLRCT